MGLIDGLGRRRERALLARERAQARNRAAEDHCDVFAQMPAGYAIGLLPKGAEVLC